jgi:hypothetical protein
MSIPHPQARVPYETFVRAQQAKEKKAHPYHLLTAFYPGSYHLLPRFLPSSCATVASMSTFYRFLYRLTGHFADWLQVDCRLVAGQSQAPHATLSGRKRGVAA